MCGFRAVLLKVQLRVIGVRVWGLVRVQFLAAQYPGPKKFQLFF